MNFVPENLNELQNFEKNQENPLRSLNIGQAGKLNKITSDDLELLTFYTNAKGKGHEGGGDDFYEIFGEKEYPEYLKKAKDLYKTLNHYEYYFGDHFQKGEESEMNEYIHDYLRQPEFFLGKMMNIMYFL